MSKIVHKPLCLVTRLPNFQKHWIICYGAMLHSPNKILNKRRRLCHQSHTSPRVWCLHQLDSEVLHRGTLSRHESHDQGKDDPNASLNTEHFDHAGDSAITETSQLSWSKSVCLTLYIYPSYCHLSQSPWMFRVSSVLQKRPLKLCVSSSICQIRLRSASWSKGVELCQTSGLWCKMRVK